ncbi:MAG: hypothetical protein E6K54_06845 [Gammaproteobacteria bacterium]|nr:MAG: hypothetical protein E6K54_06845 [Gammaproteobacteria bacterium]
MFKKVLSNTVLSVSVLAAMTANAAAPGVYVTGQLGYANTHMSNKTRFDKHDIDLGKNHDLANNGIAGRLALGYQFNQNFAVEVGYLGLSQRKLDIPNTFLKDEPGSATLQLQQHAIDLVGKGILPVTQTINVYGKLGVAYLTTDLNAKIVSGKDATLGLNHYANVAKHKWAPEAAIGVSYDFTPNVSIDTSWTHIQPLGSNKPGNIDFVAVGVGYNFG